MTTPVAPLNELWYQLREVIMPLLTCSVVARWYDELSMGGTRKPSDAFPGFTRPIDWKWTPGQPWPATEDPELQGLGMRRVDDVFAMVTDARHRIARTQETLRKYGHLVDQALNPGGRTWSMAIAKHLNEAAFKLKFLEMGWHLMPFNFKQAQVQFESVLPVLRSCISDVDTLASLEPSGARQTGKQVRKPPAKSPRQAMAQKVRDLLSPGNPPFQGTKQELAEAAGYTHQSSLAHVKHFAALWDANAARLAPAAEERRQRLQRPS